MVHNQLNTLPTAPERVPIDQPDTAPQRVPIDPPEVIETLRQTTPSQRPRQSVMMTA